MIGPPLPTRLDLYVTHVEPCPYLPGRHERKVLAELSCPGSQEAFELLSRAGFRRSRRWIYRPACPDCTACLPVRIPTGRFRTTRSFKRILRRNRDVRLSWRGGLATDEQWELFSRYVRDRHGDGEMAGMSRGDFATMVEESPIETVMAELRDGGGQLLAACLVDRLSDGLSAVYSFFEPDEADRSLGTLVVLRLVEAARRRGLDHVYLGYWVPGSRKMDYKGRFRPLEVLGEAGWATIDGRRPLPHASERVTGDRSSGATASTG